MICPIVSTVNLRNRARVMRNTARATELSGKRSLLRAYFDWKALRNGSRGIAALLAMKSRKKNGVFCLQLNFIYK